MIDIHCHILPFVDDGAADWQEAVEMARIAEADGIRHIVATPHFHMVMPNGRDIVEPQVRELQSRLDKAGIDVKVHPGNEVRLENTEQFYRLAEAETFCWLDANNTYLLLEQPWKGYQPDTVEVIGWLVRRGVTPIVPHPERHPFFRENFKLLERLLAEGAWLQVSVDSLLGKNGEDARDFAFMLCDEGLIHTIASDAHNTRRKPNLAEGFRLIGERAGMEEADAIVARLKQIIGIAPLENESAS